MKRAVVLPCICVLACVVLAGCGSDSSSGPQATVKAFLDEVNKGDIQAGKLYFSGEYSGGYDEYDSNNLEKLFPPGSIKNVSFSNVKVIGERATLTVTIQRNIGNNYVANLSMVKKQGQWKIDYDGMTWPFEVE